MWERISSRKGTQRAQTKNKVMSIILEICGPVRKVANLDFLPVFFSVSLRSLRSFAAKIP
jgi:hypothetical protein